jgi:hypothetical protein
MSDKIDETLTKLTELVNNQQKALKMADDLLNLKSKLIKICEEETEFYKKENLRLHKILSFLFVILCISSFISIISLVI